MARAPRPPRGKTQIAADGRRIIAGKAANGEGSVYYELSRDRWVASISVRDGQRTSRRLFTARTRELAVHRRDAAIDAQRQGRPVPDRSTLVGDYCAWWAEIVLPGTVKAVTERDYREKLRNYLDDEIRAVRLVELGPNHVVAWQRRLVERNLSANTIRLARAPLRRALRSAEGDGLIARNAVSLAAAPKVRRTRPADWLRPAEARTFLTYIRTHRDRRIRRWEMVMTLMLGLGLRREEALGLSWPDIDLDASPPKVTIHRTLVEIKGPGGGLLWEHATKTRSSGRTIPLPPFVVDCLRRWRKTQIEERLLAGPEWVGAGWPGLVCTNGWGGAIYPSNVTHACPRLTEQAGVGRFTAHQLRHSAASLMLDEGVPLKTVSELLGHGSIGITADTYGHLGDRTLVAGSDAMQRQIGGE